MAGSSCPSPPSHRSWSECPGPAGQTQAWAWLLPGHSHTRPTPMHFCQITLIVMLQQSMPARSLSHSSNTNALLSDHSHSHVTTKHACQVTLTFVLHQCTSVRDTAWSHFHGDHSHTSGDTAHALQIGLCCDADALYMLRDTRIDL